MSEEQVEKLISFLVCSFNIELTKSIDNELFNVHRQIGLSDYGLRTNDRRFIYPVL